MKNRETVNIIGAGLAGLSAALTLADASIPTRLISVQASERAQSNLAEGGINAALNVMGENDTVREHAADTEKGGCFLADPNMIRRLTEAAPDIVRSLIDLGVPFHREDGRLIQRNFGGQKKKRTAYAKSSTGKVIMAALIDAVRKEEAAGKIERLCHHRFEKLVIHDGSCIGVQIRDMYQKRSECFEGPVIIACGGFNGMFGGATTGTTANTGSVHAELFSEGVVCANLEFLQYHPTTAAITGKRMLISEAARGEGGRLFFYEDGAGGRRRYFMEEKYGERGNLMPRDVISREMAGLNKETFLDLTGLPEKVWQLRLSDLREEIIHYQGTDPAGEPVRVSPGIHFCMGGIHVDPGHRTNIRGLYAAGECAAAYHGANRLGGNSLLGALFGGKVAALSAAEDLLTRTESRRPAAEPMGDDPDLPKPGPITQPVGDALDLPKLRPTGYQTLTEDERQTEYEMENALCSGLGILRDHSGICSAISRVEELEKSAVSDEMKARLLYAKACLCAARARCESRGAHTRTDYPDTLEAFRKTTIVSAENGRIRVNFETIPEAEV